MADCKILSLDGGGSWALIQVRVLKDIYGDITGHELLKKFDLVIANSGGSLVLASLCVDLKLSDIEKIFLDGEKRRKVFSELTTWEKIKNFVALFSKKIGLGPRYSTDRKRQGLHEVLKGAPRGEFINSYLDEIPALIGKKDLRLVIVGFDYFRERANFFRSDTESIANRFNGGKHFRITLLDAIHASSNAPVNYFHKPAYITLDRLNANPPDTRKTYYWDGAVGGFNNPVLAGLIEAKTNGYGDDFTILSIGTGTGTKAVLTDYKESNHPEYKEIYDKNKDNPLALTDTDSGFFGDVKKLATSVLGDPPDTATFIAYVMLDPKLDNNARLVRINPCYSPEKNSETKIFEIPGPYKSDPKGREKFMKLLDLDMDAVDGEDILLLSDLCDKFIRNDINSPGLSNQLIRGDYNGEHVLGYESYRDAKLKWNELEGSGRQ